MSLGWSANGSIRKSTRGRKKGHGEFAVSFSSSCAVSCRLILDDIPAKETIQFTISPTLTWPLLHNSKNSAKNSSSSGLSRTRWWYKSQLTAQEDPTDFHSFWLYTFKIIRIKIVLSFSRGVKNGDMLWKKPILGGCYVKATVLQITLASLWEINSLMLLALVFTSLLPRPSQATSQKVGEFSSFSHNPHYSMASWTQSMGMVNWRKPRKRERE